ncbi:putative flippase [Halapricum desulfuricans]|uniref:Putative flippase n=1 Tax=Halapricum desulfuricans TaxID=2841257 RepID=A0A897NE98_9EURY|nr:flippase-like domain-containing protein [Halapricum desulfuricans]QSG11002.1 putative flippase [Halapricum desulfuricans]
MNGDRTVTVLLFLVALAVLGALVWVAGVEETLTALGRARLPLVAVVVALTVVWLVSWGLSLYVVLGALGAPVSAPKAVLVFTAAMFSNNITPFGQAGGEPVSALLISEAADSEYETGLAAIASVDTLHFVPSIGMALLGVALFGMDAVTASRDLAISISILVGLFVLVVGAAVLIYHYHHRIEQALATVVTPIARALSRVIPGRTPPGMRAVENRIGSFFESIDRVGADRRALALAGGFSTIGWFTLGVTLWTAVIAVEASIPLAAALVAVPIGLIAGATPLPGGSGAIETAIAAILVSLTPVSNGGAVAAVLVYRLATYWLPTVVGGLVATGLGARTVRSR